MTRSEILRAAALVVSCAIAAGCVRADPTQRAWHEVRTPRFTLVTDIDADDAVDRARELDERGAALADFFRYLVPRRIVAPSRHVRIVHLESCTELEQIYGSDVGGFVTSGAGFGYERLIVSCESGDYAPEILLHELTHDLSRRYFAQLPSWLSEGLATYLQTITVDNGNAVIGHASRIDSRQWRALQRLPSLDELLSMDPQTFYDLPTRRGYFAAWKLTHLMANRSPEHARRFQIYLAALASGAGETAAFDRAFGDMRDRLSDEYRSYHLTRQINVRRVPYRSPPSEATKRRSLTVGEIRGLWIELALVRPDRDAVLSQLRGMERDAPTWPRRLYWRAVVEHRLRLRGGSPARWMRQYVALEPDDGEGWLALLQLELDRIVPESSIGVEPDLPRRLEKIEDEVRGLLRVASTPAELDAVGWIYALRRQWKTGLNFTKRALALEPGCAGCWDTLALHYYHAGRFREAVLAQERAVGLMAERRTIPPAIQARLRLYRRAVAAAPPPPAPAPSPPSAPLVSPEPSPPAKATLVPASMASLPKTASPLPPFP